jgi:hypothetical protein
MQLKFRKSLLNLLWISLDWIGNYLPTRRQAKRIPLKASSTRLGEFITEIPVPVEIPPALPIVPQLTPSEIEAIQVAERAFHSLQNQSPFQPIQLPQEPHETLEEQNRSERVMALLDEAWSQGLTTYPLMIAYVKDHSGQGCSKRVVANWKRERGLIVV